MDVCTPASESESRRGLIYNQRSFIKSPTKPKRQNSNQAECTAYTRACLNTDAQQQRLTLQGTRLHGIPVRLAALLLLGEQLDEVVDTEDGDGGLRGKLQTLCFDRDGLVHAGLTVVSWFAVYQVQANPEIGI